MSTATLPPPAKATPKVAATPPSRGFNVDPQDVELLRYRFSPEDYERISDLGIFDGTRTELIDGYIFAMPAQKDTHPIGLSLSLSGVTPVFDPRHFWIRTGAPLAIAGFRPEPDLSVVAGTPRDWLGKGHPPSALLIVEISDATLRYDRGAKANLYALSGTLDYWRVNLVDNVLEVCRNPVADAAAPFGHRYADVRVLDANATVSPLAMPGATVKVADLLP